MLVHAERGSKDPDPTYGISMRSSMPWTVPSSPYGSVQHRQHRVDVSEAAERCQTAQITVSSLRRACDAGHNDTRTVVAHLGQRGGLEAVVSEIVLMHQHRRPPAWSCPRG